MANPKNIQGISLRDFVIPEPFEVECYCSCNNCGEKWTYKFKAYAVTGAQTTKKYDHCTECYLKENKDASKSKETKSSSCSS